MKKKIKFITVLIVIIILLSVIAGLIGYLISMLERPPTTFDYGFGIQTSSNNNDFIIETTTDNFLFNGKEYTFDLNNIYDDDNYSKLYTDAYFQTNYFNITINDWNSVINNDTVLPVNNTVSKSPSNIGVRMINGTFDNTDNMKIDDGSYSEFTSTEYIGYNASYSFIGEVGKVGIEIDFIDVDSNDITSVIFNLDNHRYVLKYDNNLAWQVAYHHINNRATGSVEFWIQLEQDDITSVIRIRDGVVDSSLVLEFRPNGQLEYYDGSYHNIMAYAVDTWYHFRIEWECVDDWHLWIDEVSKDGGVGYGFWIAGGVPTVMDDFEIIADVNSIFYIDAYGEDWDLYYTIGDNLEYIVSELNYTVDLNFNEVDVSNLLALDVSSYHYTNLPITIVGNIYNYTSSSYVQMFSSINTVETENYFMNNITVSDFLSISGNLRLQFEGIDADIDFIQLIDYIKVSFYYKMNLTHKIIFEMNGLWKYRWKLIGSLQYTDWVVFEVILTVSDVSEMFLTLIIMLLFIVLMLLLYFKLKSSLAVKFPLIAVVYLFGLIINVNSLGSSIPLTPMLQIFLLFFESVIFLITSLEYYKIKKIDKE